MAKKSLRFLLCGVLVLIMCLPQFTASAIGDSTFYATTPYTGMVVAPGKKYELEVTLENKTPSIRQVGLSVTSLPEKWSAYFDANGKNVTELTVKPENLLYVKFVITVPEDTADGTYEVVSSFFDESGSQDLTYKLTIQNDQSSDLQGKLDVQFPELTGPSGAVFTYRVTYNNDTGANKSFSLASQMPEGWNISFKPMYESKTVASIVVDAYGTQVLDVEVSPPANVEAGKYTVPIAFISDNEMITTDLFLAIEGTYTLKISTPDDRLNADAYAGRETALPIVVANTGTAPLRDLALTASAPTGWSAAFDNASILLLEPGQSTQVLLTIKPGSRAVSGDYMLSVSGSNYGVRASSEIRVMVKTPVYWGFVGLALIAAIALFILFVFRKFGRK